MNHKSTLNKEMTFEEFKKEVLEDYKLGHLSRQLSLTGRKEVLSGRGTFGIFGGGKELPQLAWAKVFKPGDFRSGYYRDQTIALALGWTDPEEFFAQLYGHPDIEYESHSAGRNMNCHYATPYINDKGEWLDLTNRTNTSGDIATTGGQMPRLVGLAQASKVYRENPQLKEYGKKFSDNGNEIAWGTIGNASTSEGVFWEALNAAGVMKIPMVMNIWDDEYGISVHAKYQTTKQNISEILKGFQRDKSGDGLEILTVKGWDYPALVETYRKAEKIAREEHVPVVIHVTELVQPQGHSTSGSHERYKSEERLQWEREYDGLRKFREWILENNLATEEELDEIEEWAKKRAKQAAKTAWERFTAPKKEEKKELLQILAEIIKSTNKKKEVEELAVQLAKIKEPYRKDIGKTARKVLLLITDEEHEAKKKLQNWLENWLKKWNKRYDEYLFDERGKSARDIKPIPPEYDKDAPIVDGRIIIRDNFNKLFEKYPELMAFGEDVGFIGDVNQGMEGLQKKYGEIRVSDTGIREITIIGQGIGLAMRGLRPIAEIQYLDYVPFALQALSDDLATVHWRSYGRQIAPLIVRTRGHRLEGIFHSGSQMSGYMNLMRGVNFLVPRNFTQAAGMYNTLMESNEPAFVVEPLNAYRLKEKMPKNIGEYKIPIGKVEVLKEGTDITLVSYGSTLRLVMQAADELEKLGISAEVIDVQSLWPFDLDHDIAKSLKKTNRLLVVDEDVPGGASAYILDKVLNEQGGYFYLDSQPQTLAAKEHRPAYSVDGDYFSKPQVEDVMEKVYDIMSEANPSKFPPVK